MTGAFTDIQITLGSNLGAVNNSLFLRGLGTNTFWTVTITAGSGGGSSTSSGSSSSPTLRAVTQQFGRAASGSCDAAEPRDINWAGVASGGWGESWAQWMHDGTGGPVCTRTLVYSAAQARWLVG